MLNENKNKGGICQIDNIKNLLILIQFLFILILIYAEKTNNQITQNLVPEVEIFSTQTALDLPSFSDKKDHLSITAVPDLEEIASANEKNENPLHVNEIIENQNTANCFPTPRRKPSYIDKRIRLPETNFTMWTVDEIGVILVEFHAYMKLNYTAYAVNVGARDGSTNDPLNYLFLHEGYLGLLIEGDSKFSSTLRTKFPPPFSIEMNWVFPNNIVDMLDRNNVPKDFTIFKMDIDAWDCEVIEQLLETGYHPIVIVAEINVRFPLGHYYAMNWDKNGPEWNYYDRGDFPRCSLSYQSQMLRPYGYVLFQLQSDCFEKTQCGGCDSMWIKQEYVQLFNKYRPTDNKYWFDKALVNWSWRNNVYSYTNEWYATLENAESEKEGADYIEHMFKEHIEKYPTQNYPYFYSTKPQNDNPIPTDFSENKDRCN